jgi:coenzyme F420-0:L-glutamate ligase/coenzyme F420-1:gamma-L-glutamate ligase
VSRADAGVRVWALPGLPEIAPGDDLAALLAAARGAPFGPGEVLVIAHKVVSKAEGRVVSLDEVEPSPRALELAAQLGKEDPRHVEVVLRETAEIVRAQRGVLISRTRHGFVCANAGVDASNAGEGRLVLLPLDPDASARRLRASLPGRPAVVIADSFGRAWRHGQCDVAIAIAGLAAMDDWRGRSDSFGRELHATCIAIADEAAAAADLARAGKDAREPAVVVEGLGRHVVEDDGPGAAALVRAREEDLFG